MNLTFAACCSRYVKTTANATVDHLSKYLALRVALEDGRAGGETEDRERNEGGEAGSGEASSLSGVSEKQYTIYILTRGGQFSVSGANHSGSRSSLAVLSVVHSTQKAACCRRPRVRC